MSGYLPLLGIAGMIGLNVGANPVLGLVLFGFGGLIYAFVLRALPLVWAGSARM